ncbi:MAG: serine/threonine protein phosphatase [Alphaproteobacteria bacterium]|nr:serine/threonine protein phosphatase [Alphaproteobacteria bacterium]
MAALASDLIYAVGDVHGRSDLLARLHDLIREDAAARPPGSRTLVYLGDFVDRGHDSRGVIDLVLAPDLPGFECLALLGNHDWMMREFLRSPLEVGPGWMLNGARATLQSYGVKPPSTALDVEGMLAARDALAEALPMAHWNFLNDLRLYLARPGYLFVHAGIRPGRPADKQSIEDLIWIREEFLDSDADHGAVVVHGHTIAPAPDVRRNRIGIDTGAYYSGRLTAVVLGNGETMFLST